MDHFLHPGTNGGNDTFDCIVGSMATNHGTVYTSPVDDAPVEINRSRWTRTHRDNLDSYPHNADASDTHRYRDQVQRYWRHHLNETPLTANDTIRSANSLANIYSKQQL